MPPIREVSRQKSQRSSKNDIIGKLPECRLYHPKSELRHKLGYYPNLNDYQFDAAKKILEHIISEDLNFNVDDEREFLKILRFLRARQFNIEETMIMIRADVEFRADDNRLSLRQETAEEVLEGKVFRCFPTWIQGYDKQCRPICWRQFGKFELPSLLKHMNMRQLINYHIWESEQLLRVMLEKSQETGMNIETFSVVVDASGWTLSQATREAYFFIKEMSSTDADHYPERLGSLIVINAPSMLAWAWMMAQGFLDDVQQAKIRIYGTDSEEWQPVLFEMIDPSQVPVKFGGHLPDLTPQEAIESMTPPPRVIVVYENNYRSQVMCGAPVSKNEKHKNSNKKTENIDFASPGTDQGSVVAKKDSAWMGLFNCKAPTCNAGDDDFDFYEEDPKKKSKNNKPRNLKKMKIVEETKVEEDEVSSYFADAQEWDDRSAMSGGAIPIPPPRSRKVLIPKVASPDSPPESSFREITFERHAPKASTGCKSCSIM